MDLILSKNFTLSEFTASKTARKYNIDNTPTVTIVMKLQQLVIHCLQPLRDALGVPVKINSGYRSAAVNSHPDVRGVPTSQHLVGEAADIRVESDELGNKMFAWLRNNVEFDQLIKEHLSKDSKVWWIHISYRAFGNNRKEVIENLIKNK